MTNAGIQPAKAPPDWEADAELAARAAAGEQRAFETIMRRNNQLLFRTVFMLRAVQEFTVEETAAALSIPEATVRTRFFRARGLMREALSRDLDQAYVDAFAFDGERCDRIVARVMARINAGGNTLVK